MPWIIKNHSKVEHRAKIIADRDQNGDGLIEYEYSGNSDSWVGNHKQRPANWWDTIGYGHKDAFNDIISLTAIEKYLIVAEKAGIKTDPAFKVFLDRGKSIFSKTFYNPKTGILGG